MLVIDDEEETLDIFCEFFTGLGFEVARAVSAREAPGLIDSFRPDVVLLDLFFPGGATGYSVLGYIKRVERRTERSMPVIVVSGRLDSSIVKKVVDLGASGVVAKPVDLQRLARDVERVSPRRVEDGRRQMRRAEEED